MLAYAYVQELLFHRGLSKVSQLRSQLLSKSLYCGTLAAKAPCIVVNLVFEELLEAGEQAAFKEVSLVATSLDSASLAFEKVEKEVEVSALYLVDPC